VTDGDVVAIRVERPQPWRGFAWLALRECHRVLRLWTQTTLAPVISSLLFIVVFGLSLGGRISTIDGFDYEIFIVPGLIAMAMAQAVYSNNSSTIFQARNDRYIDDVLAAPMHTWQMNLGFGVGGVFRSVVIGVALTALAVPLTGAPVEHPFLGGVFYSVDRLGSPWEQISHANPLFYVVEAIRYGFLGSSDVSPWIAFGVIAAIAAALIAWSQYLFATGHRLKP
jgi:ABC-2 type transport system permease protein